MKILYLPNCWSQQRQHEKKRWIWPVHLAMEAEYHRLKGDDVIWGTNTDEEAYRLAWYGYTIIGTPGGLPFLDLPHPDRIFTDAFDDRYQQNGNFKHHPGTYIQSAAGCWWGRCSFCVEHTCADSYQVRSVDDVITEIKECKRLGFKEIFDDAATLPTGSWRDDFVQKLQPLGITFSCNMRFGTLKGTDYIWLKSAGFRMLLYGLESANQLTLDKINKGINVDEAVKELMLASRYGLEPHVSYMVGYPWETKEDTMRTINLVKWLLTMGYAKTAQCSFYTPPTNQEQGNEQLRKYVDKHYSVAFNPLFWYNKIVAIKTMADFNYLLRGIKEGVYYAKANCLCKFKV